MSRFGRRYAHGSLADAILREPHLRSPVVDAASSLAFDIFALIRTGRSEPRPASPFHGNAQNGQKH